MFKINVDCFMKLFLMTLLIVANVLSATAQDGTATLRGTIIDSNGAVVPAATVSVANEETGTNRRTATTSESGDYVFASLTPGLYRVTVEAANFKKSVKENIRLNVGETQEFDFSLEVGASQETVTVTSDEPLVETSTSKIGGQNLRLAYKFNFTERINAGFTFEVFNLANRANYDETTVSGDRSQSTFLIPSVAEPPRTLQLGFRVAF
jgi:type 1 fimbria pilin